MDREAESVTNSLSCNWPKVRFFGFAEAEIGSEPRRVANDVENHKDP